MADRDSVMKQLEECLTASCRGFRTCPYDKEWDAVKAAYDLLKEQEPTKTKASAAEPIKRVWTKSIEYVCAACSHKVGLRYRGRDIWYFRDDECKNCGRAVKWE